MAWSLLTVGKSARNSARDWPSFEVVDQGLERNPGADEYRCPFEDFGVAVDCALMFHSSISFKL